LVFGVWGIAPNSPQAAQEFARNSCKTKNPNGFLVRARDWRGLDPPQAGPER
jgi:hypothetical protein